MSRPPIIPAPLSLANPGYHLAVEQQFLAMGAAREMTRRQRSLDQERDVRSLSAICDWENEGGSAPGVRPPVARYHPPSTLVEPSPLLGGNLWVRAIQMCVLLTGLTLMAIFMLIL